MAVPPTSDAPTTGELEVPSGGDVATVTTDEAADPGPRPSWWRRLDKKLLAASLVIALGLVLVGFAVSRSVSGDEAARFPPAVEAITPAFDAVQVPSQSSVIADLTSGNVGYLIVDGVELPTVRLDEFGSQDVEPGEQVEFPPGARFEPGNATLTFTPGAEQPIESFDAGVHTVRVVYWKELEGEGTARSYGWSFSVV